MFDWIREIFSSDSFMPHGHCYLWRPGLLWLHALADAATGVAYLTISYTLYRLLKRIQLPFTPMIAAFGVFIAACGLTHLMEVVTLWWPYYWLSAGLKAVTAVASVATGVSLLPMRGKVVALAQATRLAEERRVELEHKNAELEKLYGKVKELDALKTEFFANVSHELRTPLTLILGPLESLLGRVEQGSPERRDLEVVVRNARLLLRLVNDLLDVAKLEAGKMRPRHVEVNVAELARLSASIFETLAEERHVDFSLEVPEAVPAQADPDQLQRVMVNLLANAFAFTPPEGQVRCSVRAEHGRAVVEVRDSGPGVEPDQRTAIFERFHQGEIRGQQRSGGTGLGLAIARDFVQLHGGTIRVEDAPGGGALFRFELPQRAAEGTSIHSVRPLPIDLHAADDLRVSFAVAEVVPVSEGRPRLLLVEDNPDMRRFVSECLASEFEVSTANDGREGLKLAEQLRPDLMITDVMMPTLGGDELVYEVRRIPALAAMPIVLLTARADDDLKVRLLRGGAQDFVTKPFSAEELRARARNLTSMKRARDILQDALATQEQDLAELAREVTLRKTQVEAALQTARAARAQAERASEVKSAFLRLVSHELRTPMTSMLLNLQLLSQDWQTLPRERLGNMGEKLFRSARRLLDLIESVLDYTRIEAGKMVVNAQPFDLRALLEDVVEDLLPQAQQKLLALELATIEHIGPLMLESDPKIVRLIAINLIVNAIKYTPAGGIRISVERGPRGYRISVRDTGPGIAREDQERLFQPFSQLAPLDNKHQPGVGLGLALVKEMASALGAKVDLVSDVGKGSEFSVTLPLPPTSVSAA